MSLEAGICALRQTEQKVDPHAGVASALALLGRLTEFVADTGNLQAVAEVYRC